MTHSQKSKNRQSAMINVALVALWAIASAGCHRQEEIRQYKVLKTRSGLDSLKSVSDDSITRAEKPTSRMVVAIAAREKATWFFKIASAIENVNVAETQWREFFGNLEFDENGNPKWELPDGWTDAGTGGPMRFATLQIPSGEGLLELAISSLSPNQDLAGNVNRWRGQLGLPGIESSQLNLQPIDTKDGQILLFDDIGVLAGGMGRAAPSGPTQPPPAIATLKYETPKGWTEGRKSSIVKVRLFKEIGDKRVQISVTELPADVNRWQPNVERWIGELNLELEENKQEFVDRNSSEIEVGGVASKSAELDR